MEITFAQEVKKNHQDRMETSKIFWSPAYPLECKIVRRQNEEREAIQKAAKAEIELELAQIKAMMEA